MGATASNPFGYADGGFNITFANGATNGDIHDYQNVIVPATGLPLIGLWQPDGRNIDPDLVTDATSRSTSLTSFNSLGASGTWTLFLADLESGATNILTEWGLDISGATTPALVWTNPAAIVYGTALSSLQLNATVLHNGTNVPGNLAYSPTNGARLNAGLAQTLSVSFTPTDTNSFLPVSTNVTVNVNQAPLTITAVDQAKVYGEAIPALAASYGGFVNGETTNSLSGQPALSTGANASSSVAGSPYVINVTHGSVGSSNYSFIFVNGLLSVTKANTSVAINSSRNPALPGVGVMFNATLSAQAPGGGIPTGTVQFLTNGVNFGAAATLTNAAASSVTVATLPHGSNLITANYAGDSNFQGSTTSLGEIINIPPVAHAASYVRPPNARLNINVLNLLTNATDADGDSLSLLSVSPTSTNGAIVSASSGFVFYTPRGTNGNVTDAFTYTVTDSFGGTNSALVTITLLNTNSAPSVNITGLLMNNRLPTISFAGIPGRSYLIQAATNLGQPDWTTIATNTAGTNGLFQYTDAQATNFSNRYYRTATP